jgi:hypothetical protein
MIMKFAYKNWASHTKGVWVADDLSILHLLFMLYYALARRMSTAKFRLYIVRCDVIMSLPFLL